MLSRVARALFGSANDRTLKAYRQRVPAINALEDSVRGLTDEALQAKTAEFKQRLAKGETLDDLLCEAFAVCREASRRVLGKRHFDVQLIGGMVLHDGRIAEMRTGEGKTLVGTLPVYLNALGGKGVHVVTVNDYLASRDAAEMARLYSFLGLTTGVVVPNMPDEERRAAYGCDITYGTNNEFGFDYLRDNMKYSLEELVQRPFNFAIVDEVDSILIDEARTPLIISGPADDSSELYEAVDAVMVELVKDPKHYEKEEKHRTVILTEEGTHAVEELLAKAGILQHGGLYDVHNVTLVHHVQQALRAHTLFTRDVDYIVRDGKVMLIDEFTGRMMDGRRYSDGLHQALEAKEGVEIQQENQTLASITFQNYFRLYPKLAGMTGTAMTEADEFMEIYDLTPVAIPTNLPVKRQDTDDEVYLNEGDKFNAVANLVKEINAKGQPVLVGTTSIEKSEHLSNLLHQKGIAHNVLNARHHEREAAIVAQAGAPGAITIATNMAGRGTDIKLGGNLEMLTEQRLHGVEDAAERERLAEETRRQVEENHKKVHEAGGLYVIGTERHESRRVDNQLRGRAGRQGDPGNSRFFLSLDDDLIRIFGTSRMAPMMQKLGLKEGEAIVHPWLNKALEKAQKKVEARNFDMRKNTLKYDDVMNDQRKEVYAQRRAYMLQQDLSAEVAEMRSQAVMDMVHAHIPEKSFPEAWDMEGLAHQVRESLNLDLPVQAWAEEHDITEDVVLERLEKATAQAAQAKAQALGPDMMRLVERHVVLTSFDAVWKEHLHALDHLRQGIGLRAYGQRDPLNEYKREAFEMFSAMLDELRLRVTRTLAYVQLAPAPSTPAPQPPLDQPAPAGGEQQSLPTQAQQSLEQPSPLSPAPASSSQAGDVDEATVAQWRQHLARNAPCPCGSGVKFKHCHGRVG
ncbi:preprotein translocase subunit SecA [Formicincola oecophyllae]|uniref:Protein translocase subunit SecA n=1 Tax=Formicincola oecophyllae TaxID=2558361 RepID=A0A4Y6U995_9PROT|nr:preprotein translocase subunit SecA [Formicincola oecophyllae]QDH13774.1 preprotein translocase subunit SecA [Formicincola oecophyllae]